jgi:hypothetical protein
MSFDCWVFLTHLSFELCFRYSCEAVSFTERYENKLRFSEKLKFGQHVNLR